MRVLEHVPSIDLTLLLLLLLLLSFMFLGCRCDGCLVLLLQSFTLAVVSRSEELLPLGCAPI
jgi:hypothetical protein